MRVQILLCALTLSVFAFCSLLLSHQAHAASTIRTYIPLAFNPTSSATSATPLASSEELEAFRLTNQLRQQAGCGNLVIDSALQQAAVEHSLDMAANNAMSHLGTDGSLPWDRAEKYGYTGMIGENVAAGYPTPASVVEGWRTSPAHYQNMITCAYEDIGLAVRRSANGTLYWTQIFGKRS